MLSCVVSYLVCSRRVLCFVLRCSRLVALCWCWCCAVMSFRVLVLSCVILRFVALRAIVLCVLCVVSCVALSCLLSYVVLSVVLC